MRKKSKLWKELQEKITEDEKDKAIKEMGKHPGVSFVSNGPRVSIGLDIAVSELNGDEAPPPKGDPKVNSLLAKIKELTQK